MPILIDSAAQRPSSLRRLLRNFQEAMPFLKIGVFEVGSQFVNFFNRDLDIIIIGKLFSTELLGGYSLAKQLVYKPAQIINPIATKIANPLLAKFQKDI